MAAAFWRNRHLSRGPSPGRGCSLYREGSRDPHIGRPPQNIRPEGPRHRWSGLGLVLSHPKARFHGLPRRARIGGTGTRCGLLHNNSDEKQRSTRSRRLHFSVEKINRGPRHQEDETRAAMGIPPAVEGEATWIPRNKHLHQLKAAGTRGRPPLAFQTPPSRPTLRCRTPPRGRSAALSQLISTCSGSCPPRRTVVVTR
jgi:hypothetical protein